MKIRTMMAASVFTMLLNIPYGVAAVSAEQAARLGKDLTPVGAEKAGNTDGSIPEWTGGITTPPAGYTPGQHYVDPYGSDPVKFTITHENLEQYRAHLTPGQVALLEKYPDYKMNVYATHRSASYPQRIYQYTVANATTAQLVNDGNGIANTIVGFPFPEPQNGLEAIWNHIVRYRGDAVKRWIAQAAVTANGKYTLVKLEDEFDFLYAKEGAKFGDLHNILLYFKQEVTAPARLAGGVLLVHETLNQVKEPRHAWVYNPGQRRVRRAPNIAYDNPGTAADGLRTSDDFDMYNGAPDRYNWKLVGKKEIYVPYNSYKLQSDKLQYDDILKVGHLNPEYTRYELHRVWEVEATLKPGASHIYAKRVFYLDEDSWQILVIDKYDNRGQIWRVSEGHAINYYNMPLLWTSLEVHHDLQSGRYLVLGLNNQERAYDFNIKRSPADYTPASLRSAGTR